MVGFQIIFIIILLLEMLVGFLVKYNYKGIQDKLVWLFASKDIEDYVRNKLSDRWIAQTVLMLILFLLCI